jgi:hypothetical protein
VPSDSLNVKFLRSSRPFRSLGSSSILLQAKGIHARGLGKGYDEVGIHVQDRLWVDVEV